MPAQLDVEVAVLYDDDPREDIGTLQGWTRRPNPDGTEGWWGFVVIYGGVGGQRRDIIPAHRLIPLVYCGAHAGGIIAHSDDCLAEQLQLRDMKVWG